MKNGADERVKMSKECYQTYSPVTAVATVLKS